MVFVFRLVDTRLIWGRIGFQNQKLLSNSIEYRAYLNGKKVVTKLLKVLLQSP